MKTHPQRLARLLAACLFGGLSLANAQEIGLDSSTYTKFGQNPLLQWTLGEGLALWWNVPLDANGSVFEGGGHLGIELAVPANAAVGGKLTGDLDLFRLGFVVPKPNKELASVSVDLGRLVFRDPTGLYLFTAADGVDFGFDFTGLRLDLGVAYTGLTLKNASTIAVSTYDRSLAYDAKRLMSSSRLLATVGLAVPDILRQRLDLSFIMQQDLNPDTAFMAPYSTKPSGIGGVGPVNTQYSTIRLGGPIIDRLFYDVWFTYGSGNSLAWIADASSATAHSWQNRPISSFLTGFDLNYYRPDLLHSAFKVRFLWASGDPDAADVVEGNTAGDSTTFTPVTTTTLGTVFNPSLANLIFGQLGASFIPFDELPLQTGLDAMLFLRPTTGAVGAAAIQNNSKAAYLGTEIDLYAAWRIASDLGLRLNGGLFFAGIDPVGAFSANAPAVQWLISLALTLNI